MKCASLSVGKRKRSHSSDMEDGEESKSRERKSCLKEERNVLSEREQSPVKSKPKDEVKNIFEALHKKKIGNSRPLKIEVSNVEPDENPRTSSLDPLLPANPLSI